MNIEKMLLMYSLYITLLKKCSVLLRISSVNVTKSAVDLVTFTEEILNGKLHLLCSVTKRPREIFLLVWKI